MSTRILLYICVISGGLILPVWACIFSPPLSDDIKNQASHVFIGKRVKIENLDNGMELITFDVSETLKGSPLPKTTTAWLNHSEIIAKAMQPGPWSIEAVVPDTFVVGMIDSNIVNTSLLCDGQGVCSSQLPIGLHTSKPRQQIPQLPAMIQDVCSGPYMIAVVDEVATRKLQEMVNATSPLPEKSLPVSVSLTWINVNDRKQSEEAVNKLIEELRGK